jgi:hypothetical protein
VWCRVSTQGSSFHEKCSTRRALYWRAVGEIYIKITDGCRVVMRVADFQRLVCKAWDLLQGSPTQDVNGTLCSLADHSGSLNTGIVGTNPAQSMNVCPCLSVFCCSVKVKALRRADPPSRHFYLMWNLFIISEVILNWNTSEGVICNSGCWWLCSLYFVEFNCLLKFSCTWFISYFYLFLSSLSSFLISPAFLYVSFNSKQRNLVVLRTTLF